MAGGPGVTDPWVAGSFDAVGIVAARLTTRGVGAVAARRVEVRLAADAGIDRCPQDAPAGQGEGRQADGPADECG